MGFRTRISILNIFIIFCFGLLACSQNNPPVNFTDSSKLNNGAESGTIYEGKVYVTVGKRCDDGNEIHSRIVMDSSTQAQLNRENCLDIAPVQLTAADFQINTASDSLTYKSQNFSYIGFAPLGISNLIVNNDTDNFYYGYTYEGQPTFLQIFLDTDNNPATGYFRDGIGADFLIENAFVYHYSGPDGSGVWSWSSSVASANPNKVEPNISWSFPRTAIGSPTSIKLVAKTSLGFKTPIVTQVPK